jgi:hypothetical protein
MESGVKQRHAAGMFAWLSNGAFQCQIHQQVYP